MYGGGQISGVNFKRVSKAAWDDGWGWQDSGLLCRLRDAPSKEEAMAIVGMAWDLGHWGVSPSAKQMALVGTTNNHKGNMQRDIFRAAERSGIVKALPNMYYFKGRCADNTEQQLSCFLPHEIVHTVANSVGVRGLVARPEDGQLAQLVEEWCGHQDVGVADPSVVMPMGLYGDAMQYTSTMRAGGARSVVAVTMNFLGGPVQVRSRRYILSFINKARLCNCGCEGFHTLQDLFKVVAWSMSFLLGVLTPVARHDGSAWSAHDLSSRLAANILLPIAALLQLRGDWDWMSVAYRFRKATEELFCWLCNITQATFRNEFRRGAPHRNNLRTHADFVREVLAAGLDLSEIFNVPGMVLKYFAVDEMHGLGLGPLLDAIGSLFWIEITNKAWHRNIASGLDWLNKDIADFYKANPEFGHHDQIVYSQIRSKTAPYPSLKAKAAIAKHLVAYCVILAQKHAGHLGRPAFHLRPARLAGLDGTHRALVVEMFEGVAAYFSACDAEPLDKPVCVDSMYCFLNALERLNTLWCTGLATNEEKSRMPFHIRPKCHMIQHLTEDQLDLWGNPRNFNCYCDEHFIGSLKQICACCKHPRTLERVALLKSRLLAGADEELLWMQTVG